MFPNGGICLSAGTNPSFYWKSKPNFIKMGIERTRKPIVSAKKKNIFTFSLNVARTTSESKFIRSHVCEILNKKITYLIDWM